MRSRSNALSLPLSPSPLLRYAALLSPPLSVCEYTLSLSLSLPLSRSLCRVREREREREAQVCAVSRGDTFFWYL